MKKLLLLPAVLLLVLLGAAARAETAPDITSRCRFTASLNRNDLDRLTDGKYSTAWTGTNKGWLEFILPEGEKCYGLYLHWGGDLAEFQVEIPNGDGWEKCQDGPEHLFYNQYLPLPGLNRFRLHALGNGSAKLSVGEVRLLGEGDLPDWVQLWTPFEGKADLMVLVAHPDDEVLWFGGMIPYYRGELGKKVLVVSVSKQPAVRKCELLDCLWTCGVREYPVVTGGKAFVDQYSSKRSAVLNMWGGLDNLNRFIVGLIRQYRPDVIATHDLGGEYGHGAHRAVAYAATKCVSLAAKESFDPSSFRAYGAWSVKKLYLHLYEEGQITMDWSVPLSAFGGKTGYEVACEAFKRHRTQNGGKYQVLDSGRNDCRLFGLYYSAVGPDTEKNDLFENIP